MTDDNKLKLLKFESKPSHPEPSQAAVAMLRDLLAAAERGEVQSVVVVTTHHVNGETMTGTGFSLNGGNMALLGALEYAKSRVLTYVET